MDYLAKFNRDLGGKKNPRNGIGGTYDNIALCCMWEVCKEKITVEFRSGMRVDVDA